MEITLNGKAEILILNVSTVNILNCCDYAMNISQRRSIDVNKSCKIIFNVVKNVCLTFQNNKLSKHQHLK